MQVSKKKNFFFFIIFFFYSGHYIPPHLRNKDVSQNGMLCWFTLQTVDKIRLFYKMGNLKMHANLANI